MAKERAEGGDPRLGRWGRGGHVGSREAGWYEGRRAEIGIEAEVSETCNQGGLPVGRHDGGRLLFGFEKTE